ncbi:hypothetical protein Cgig2_001768 [Carnegiea gigantea]|uniref:[Histone H3]-trimethyl-L-lysine(4) demethylase n=1 Tax=Carnegiea gigantea TaxID=171969 RepID=A0A9Q1KAQ3_9CARY|nr:hypothetical protein Cgig2_001768 [Carnegiea gigantea]
MGKGRPRAVERGGGLGQLTSVTSGNGSLNIPLAPVYYPSEEEFKDPLEFIYKIRAEAEPYGICKIVPPKSWKPPFALDLNSFTFPTKTQAIHQLQARPASCDSKTFELEYVRFLEAHCGRKSRKKVIFEGEELDLCKLFNAAKRFGGYDKVTKEKKWGEVFKFVRPGNKISECAKYVLGQLYREHLYDYEEYYCKLHIGKSKGCKRGVHNGRKSDQKSDSSSSRKRRKNNNSFGFVPGKRFSLEAFRKLADRTKKKWFGTMSCSRVQIEKKFWEIVEGSLGEVEVMYGSDLDTSIYGSGFPSSNDERLESVDADVWDEYCNSPWNLNNLPKLRGSMLRAVHHNIAGVMVPWLYIGMLFSAFCWHFEDHCFYSMNYHHWGEPKCWYSVPGGEASAFEKVMRSCLPDLFDAQPDLLFQLVTMLNPSVLQENGVPVYSVLQEPGNFVITFPRSYHGGFNFGLNCAEAVNFAPADWLPHGGFASELYQLYHKPAVLSHEELLCVVAKIGCDTKAAPYMNKELLRVFGKEKMWRERLWKKGLVKTSVMAPRKNPDYVGTEEDPTCIICQQYLYLSAVVCHCRPATFVCLEHWEHLCECTPRKRHLLYRHSLAELDELICMPENAISGCSNSRRQRSLLQQNLSSTDSGALTKKVKGKQMTLAQLAEEWLLNSCKIFQLSFSSNAYANALKEAQQFLWSGSEMDPVRDVVKNLVQGKQWAERVRQCLSAVESWSNSKDVEKVCIEHIDDLLKHDPLPCNEPVHLKLKEHAEAARVLVQEIVDILSEPTSSLSALEDLHMRASNFPVYVNGSDKLAKKISSMKAWIDNVKKCVLETRPAAIETDFLYHLKSEMLELQMHVPEKEMLLKLIGRAELCQAQCKEMLKGPVTLELTATARQTTATRRTVALPDSHRVNQGNLLGYDFRRECLSCNPELLRLLQKLELLVQEFGALVVNIPDLKLLRQYHDDTISWISRFNQILVNIHEREDQETVVDELKCLQRDGSFLRVRVTELALVEAELSRACCRAKALKVHRTKTTLDFVQQVLSEAAVLQIEKEQLFVSVSKMRAAAISWEERAIQILAAQSKLEDFENAIRASEEIFMTLPSLPAVKDAVSAAKSWLESSKPFLQSSGVTTFISNPGLSYEKLKEQVSRSKILEVSLAEQMAIKTVMRNCEEWRSQACFFLNDVEEMMNRKDTFKRVRADVISDIEQLRIKVETVAAAGLSLGYDFCEISMLQNASSILQWCSKVLFLCSEAPSLEDVDKLIKEMSNLPTGCIIGFVYMSLSDGISWLKRAIEVLSVSYCRRGIRNSHLTDAEDILMKSQELGNGAFHCSELEMVMSEFETVQNWMQQGKEVVGCSAEDATAFLGSLLKKVTKRYSCSNSYHLKCLVPKSVDGNNSKEFVCQYCAIVDSGSICRSKDSPLRYKGKCPQLETLVELCSDAEKFTIRIEEKDLLLEIVDQALACRGCLSEIVDSSLSFFEKDIFSISRKLTIALKALDVAGVYDTLVSRKFDLALARNSWRIRASELIEGSQKPALQQIQRHLKEGLAINVPPEDYFKQKLEEVKEAGMQWAELAKKVVGDNGNLELDKVFELITEGENLAIHFEKELKLLRARSVLYCICRKPYNQRPMIACDECDEWYHFDCINLVTPPKIYICPACKPQIDRKISVSTSVKEDRSPSTKDSEPQTPSPRPLKSQWRRPQKKSKPRKKQKVSSVADGCSNSSSCEPSVLLWRNRKPFRRTAQKRADLGNLSPFFLLEH